jgi:hypothetical protein
MVKCSKAEVRRLPTALRWKIPGAWRQVRRVLLVEGRMTQGVYPIMPTSNTAQVRPPGQLAGCRRAANYRCSALVLPDNVRLFYTCRAIAIRPRSIQKKLSGTKSVRKSSSTVRSNPWRRARQARAGRCLHRAQPRAREIHRVLPLMASTRSDIELVVAPAALEVQRSAAHSTVTDLARLRGWSTSVPITRAVL